MNRITPALAGLAVALAGCSTLQVTAADSAHKDGTHGVFFERPAFYLAVGDDADGDCTGQIMELPDSTQAYELRTVTYPFTSTSFQVSLSDGWNLTGVNGSSDSTAIGSALVSLLTGGKAAAGDGAKMAVKINGQSKVSPGLYKLTIHGDGTISSTLAMDFGGICKDVTITPPAATPPAPDPSKPKKPGS